MQRRWKARIYFVLYTVVLYAGVVGAGVWLDDIEAVFNVVGAVCSTSISMLLPCFFYFRLVALTGQPRRWKFYLSIAIFAVMTPYAVLSVVALYVNPDRIPRSLTI